MKEHAASAGVQPYLFLGGRCQEALNFYASAAGATVEMLIHFDESPDPVPDGLLQPGFADKVMHSAFRIGGSLVLAHRSPILSSPSSSLPK